MIEILQDEDQQKRGGIGRWWLRLTAPTEALQYDQAASHQERERLRRSQLISWTAPFVFFAPLLLLQQAADMGTFIGIVALMAASVMALACNRIGKQTVAALLLVFAMDTVIEGTLVTAQGGLSTGWLLSFDLFVLPLIAAGVLLNRRFLWAFMLLHAACILGDFYFLPHASDLTALIQLWHGPTVVFARPLIIQIGGCLLSFIEVRSTDQAIIRADRAQFITQLQESSLKQKEELDKGIQEIVNILTRAANGDFTAAASLPQENSLWQIAAALNTLFTRLQRSRQAETQLRQLEQEISTIVADLKKVTDRESLNSLIRHLQNTLLQYRLPGGFQPAPARSTNNRFTT
ncbi:MAG TPA: hypothetical protein VF458_03655 [Ktedonobacteraceae bacterium]